MGATNDERGLHTLSGDAIGADVIAYGGPARAGGVPGGNAFVVDPGFLFVHQHTDRDHRRGPAQSRERQRRIQAGL